MPTNQHPYNHFNLEQHFYLRQIYKEYRSEAIAEWFQLVIGLVPSPRQTKKRSNESNNTLRNVKDLLHMRGIGITLEAVVFPH